MAQNFVGGSTDICKRAPLRDTVIKDAGRYSLEETTEVRKAEGLNLILLKRLASCWMSSKRLQALKKMVREGETPAIQIVGKV